MVLMSFQIKISWQYCSLEVPGGAFEIPVFCKRIINKHRPLIVLTIGCIIKGDTKHYDFLSSSVTNTYKFCRD